MAMIFKRLVRGALASLVITTLGFGIAIFNARYSIYNNQERRLLYDLQWATEILCIGPAWYIVNKTGAHTPWDAFWKDTSQEIYPKYWSLKNINLWVNYLQIFIAWLLMISAGTLAYQFSKLGVNKAWEKSRPRRK